MEKAPSVHKNKKGVFDNFGLKFLIRFYSGFRSSKKLLLKIEESYPKLMSYDEMINRIKKGASLSRLGDGELWLILGKSFWFQRFDKTLRAKMIDALNRGVSKKLIVSIPTFFDSQWDSFGIYFWRFFWLKNYRRLKKYFTKSYYGNTQFSRSATFNYVSLSDYKSIWENRNVVFVVPKDGHFVLDNRLFGNIKSPSFIYVPRKNAFNDYQSILNKCLKFRKNVLFIICAGPTATVLSVELSDLGYQALDLGHLPNCYRQFLGETLSPEAEKNKR